MEELIKRLAQELSVPAKHVENVINLLDEGNTVPFIARYRKELHGGMDDQLIRQLSDRLQYLRGLDKRRQEVKTAIENQGKLTHELAQAIDQAQTLAEVEDLYRPYQQKRRTRATMAKEKGLEPLAQTLYEQKRDCSDPEALAQDFVNPDLGVEDVAAATSGDAAVTGSGVAVVADARRCSAAARVGSRPASTGAAGLARVSDRMGPTLAPTRSSSRPEAGRQSVACGERTGMGNSGSMSSVTDTPTVPGPRCQASTSSNSTIMTRSGNGVSLRISVAISSARSSATISS